MHRKMSWLPWSVVGALVVGWSLSAIPAPAQIIFGGATAGGTPAVQTMPGGALFGCTVSNNGADPVNDLDLAPCEAASDDAAIVSRVVLSTTVSFTKQTDAAWTAGTGAGGLCTGDVVANGTWWVWAFRRAGGLTDFCVSASLAPTLPDGGTRKRRIGSYLRIAGAIYPAVQDGDTYTFLSPVQNVSATNPGTAAVLQAVTSPVGIRLTARLVAQIGGCTTGGGYAHVYIADPLLTDEVPTGSHGPVIQSAVGSFAKGMIDVRTNTAAQVRYRLSLSDAGCNLIISTRGYIDHRGKDSP